MKKFLLISFILLITLSASAQSISRHTPTLETNNNFTGYNSFAKGARLGPVTFAHLSDPIETDFRDGTIVECLDCQATDPCVGGGSGAYAHRINGSWSCTVGGASNLRDGLILTETGTAPPSPLETAGCPSGEAVAMYGFDGSAYKDIVSWNTSGTPPTPTGSLTFCAPFTYNDSGTSFNPHRAVSILHIAGNGGLGDDGSIDDSGLMVLLRNTGIAQDYHQLLTLYAENVITGNPTFHGHAGGENSAAVYRGNLTDSRSNGVTLTGNGFYVFAGAFEKQTTSQEPSGTAGVFHGSFSNEAAGNQGGIIETVFDGYCEDINGSDTNHACAVFYATPPTAPFPSENYGFTAGDFGSGSKSYGLAISGTSTTGFSYLGGPVSLGGALRHAAAGYALDINSTIKIAGTGYIDFSAISDPGNPASGCRLFASPTGDLTGHKSDGTSCLAGGGAGTPGGSATMVQVNNGTTFVGTAGLTYVESGGFNTLKVGATGATGRLQIPGLTSGTITILAQAAAGTATLTLPNASGTFAISASAPIVVNATSGDISCATCAITSNPLSQFAQTTSAQFASVISDEQGSGGSPAGVLVFNQSPIIFTPTIASFVNATHNHTNNVGGGQLTDAALSSAVSTGKGGTGLTAAPDSNFIIGNGTIWLSVSMTNCPDTGGNHMNYVAATHSLLCGTSGGAGGGANTALSNLAAVAFSASLIPDSNNLRDLGSPSIGVRTGYFATSILTPFISTTAASPATQGLVRGANNSILVAALKSGGSGNCDLSVNTSDQFTTDCPFTSTGSSTFIELGNETTSTTSSAATARVTYNDTTKRLRVSTDAGAVASFALFTDNLSVFANTTSAQFAGIITDAQGTGRVVLATSPTLTTPVLGVATATSINKVAFTAPASSATLTLADGKTLTVNNTITLAAGADGQTFTLPSTSATLFGSTTKQDVLVAGSVCSDAGANDTYACNLSPAITAYVTGTHYFFFANTANTGAATINLNSVGPKTIVKYQGGAAQTLADNDIRAGAYVEVVYDGTNMQLVSILGNSSSSSGDITDVGDCPTGACFSSGGAGTTLTIRNATSGTVTLQTVAGALGSSVVSLPAATTTLVGKDTTDTLSNKTLDNTTVETVKDTNHSIVDDGDTSKVFKIQASSISTATTRTWTVPDVSDTFVGLTASQTLTNKTFTAPVISTISNTGTLTLPTSTDTLVGKATTDTFTNKTFNAEGTGNVLTTVEKLYFPAAACQNSTASLLWDTPTSNPAVAACDTGTNTQKGTADFADGANSLSMQTSFLLPADWDGGTIDAKVRWFSSVTSGNVVWQIATICVADAETSDPSYNTASTATDATKGTTLQDNDATISAITTTGCAAGEMMYLKIFRDPANGSDTMAGTARLRGVEVTLRRAQ